MLLFGKRCTSAPTSPALAAKTRYIALQVSMWPFKYKKIGLHVRTKVRLFQQNSAYPSKSRHASASISAYASNNWLVTKYPADTLATKSPFENMLRIKQGVKTFQNKSAYFRNQLLKRTHASVQNINIYELLSDHTLTFDQWLHILAIRAFQSFVLFLRSGHDRSLRIV